MPSNGLTEQWRAALCQWCLLRECVIQMWLYGSRARGCHRPDSDIDLAVAIRGNERETAYTIWFFNGEAWQQELTILLGHPVHLQHFNEDEPEAAPAEWKSSY